MRLCLNIEGSSEDISTPVNPGQRRDGWSSTWCICIHSPSKSKDFFLLNLHQRPFSSHSVEVKDYGLPGNIIYSSLESSCQDPVPRNKSPLADNAVTFWTCHKTRPSWGRISRTEGMETGTKAGKEHWAADVRIQIRTELKQQSLTDANARFFQDKLIKLWHINTYSFVIGNQIYRRTFCASKASTALVVLSGLQQNYHRHWISLYFPDCCDLLTLRVYVRDVKAAPSSPEDTGKLTPPQVFRTKHLVEMEKLYIFHCT